MPITEKTNGDSVNISREAKLVLLVSWGYLQILITIRGNNTFVYQVRNAKYKTTAIAMQFFVTQMDLLNLSVRNRASLLAPSAVN